MIAAVPVKMSKNAQRLPFHRMALAEDGYGCGKVADVGSVSCVPSTLWTTVIFERSFVDGYEMAC